MNTATAKAVVRFVEVPRSIGFSNFLIEKDDGEAIGWLTYRTATDDWVATLNIPFALEIVRQTFRHRENGERWVHEHLLDFYSL